VVAAALSPQVERRTPAPQARVAPRVEIFASGPGRLGISIRDVDETIAKEHKLASQAGVLVEDVNLKSPAEKAGIRAGDVVAEFDGERVRSVRQLQRLVDETSAGHAVKVGVIRDGKRLDLPVTLEAGPRGFAFSGDSDRLADELRGRIEGNILRSMPRDFNFRFDVPQQDPLPPGDQGPQPRRQPRQAPRWNWSPNPNGPTPSPWLFDAPAAGRLGVMAQELTPQLAEFFSVKEGVLVASVTPDSAASRAGLKAADVITTVNGKAVRTPDDLVRLLRDVPDGQDVSIQVVRDKKPLTLKAKLAAARSPWHA
jgi:serine protease Do